MMKVRNLLAQHVPPENRKKKDRDRDWRPTDIEGLHPASGDTPLHRAVKARQCKMAAYLVDAKVLAW